MAAIPVITRDRLASSVVGTPGVDTSGMAIGNSLADMADRIAAPLRVEAEKQRSMEDEASYHSLMVEHKLNLLKAGEEIKLQSLGNPDAAGPAMMEATKNSLAIISQKAPNPRVKLMVGAGEGLAETASLKDVYEWSFKQKAQNTLDHMVKVTDDSINRLAPIGADLNLSVEDMKKEMAPEVNLLASEVAAVKVYDPALARELEIKGMKSYYKQLFDTTLEYQPDKAVTLSNDPEVINYFTPEETNSNRLTALAAVKSFPEKEKTRQIQRGMVSNTEIISKVQNKELKYSDLDALQKKDPEGLDANANFWKLSKEISLGIGGMEATVDRDSIRASFVKYVSDLGLKDPKDPTR